MSVQFYDQQDRTNAMNGRAIAASDELKAVLESLRCRRPFFAQLVSDNGTKLLVGLAGEEGCAQFSATDGSPPYLMAVLRERADQEGEIEFLIDDSQSPVPRRFCVPYETLLRVASAFVETGQRSEDVTWEVI